MHRLTPYLYLGVESPFDASDHFHSEFPNIPAPEAIDWAHAAARGIATNLRERTGIQEGFQGLSEEVRLDLIAEIAQIIRLAKTATESWTGAEPWSQTSGSYKKWIAKREEPLRG